MDIELASVLYDALRAAWLRLWAQHVLEPEHMPLGRVREARRALYALEERLWWDKGLGVALLQERGVDLERIRERIVLREREEASGGA